MNVKNLKKSVFGLVVAAGLMVTGMSTAQAQGQRRGGWDRQGQAQQRNGGYGPVESTGNIDRNKNGIDDRYEVNGQVDINQNGIPDSQEGYNQNGRYGRDGRYDRNYPYGRNDDRYGRNDRYDRNDRYGRNDGYYGNGGYYGNDGYWANSADYQRGYSDGLSRGRDDARTNRAMDPNNSSHYRSGSQAYRAGFERGFYEAYRQNSNRRW